MNRGKGWETIIKANYTGNASQKITIKANIC